MKTRNPIAQFALVREIGLRSDDEREITLTETSTSFEAEPNLFDLATRASEAWPRKWTPTSFRTKPLFPAPWGDAPQSSTEYVRRVTTMVEQARTNGILDAERLMHPPAGWLPVVEHAMAGLGALMRHPGNRPAAVRVIQLKEKFGTLRLYIDAIGSRNACAKADQIAQWAELCSENRCMLSGQPGVLRRGSWVLTLSDAAENLRKTDPDTFSRRLYPDLR